MPAMRDGRAGAAGPRAAWQADARGSRAMPRPRATSRPRAISWPRARPRPPTTSRPRTISRP
eukprot:9327936-Pyramimonas_sp.AAC.1